MANNMPPMVAVKPGGAQQSLVETAANHSLPAEDGKQTKVGGCTTPHPPKTIIPGCGRIHTVLGQSIPSYATADGHLATT